jgi:hypothetical protein
MPMRRAPPVEGRRAVRSYEGDSPAEHSPVVVADTVE